MCFKLKYYGVDDAALSFFKLYLSNRYQYVSVKAVFSTPKPISSGVPHGSILGSLLFLIYISDSTNAVTYSQLQCYADDTQLLLYFNPADPDTAAQEMNHDLNTISQYSDEHNLKLNASKTSVLLFCSSAKQNYLKSRMKLKINETYAPFSASGISKILGVFVDEDLRFREHLKTVINRCYVRMRVLYSNRYILNFKTRKKLCGSLVLSMLQYVLLVFYPCLDHITNTDCN